jgi:hypothetical protein
VHAVLSGQQTLSLLDPIPLSALAVALDHEADVSNFIHLPGEKIRSVHLGLEAADSATTTCAEWSHVRELRGTASARARNLSS